ncbi:hypothetical protein C0J52_22552 [Blattella germanica]|nr:hypothetical protein C0J52_22552 [Blattella germanica]
MLAPDSQNLCTNKQVFHSSREFCGSEVCLALRYIQNFFVTAKPREALSTTNVRLVSLQNVFLWIARCPSSSYSRFETHIFLKVSSDAKIEPPIQVEYKRS